MSVVNSTSTRRFCSKQLNRLRNDLPVFYKTINIIQFSLNRQKIDKIQKWKTCPNICALSFATVFQAIGENINPIEVKPISLFFIKIYIVFILCCMHALQTFYLFSLFTIILCFHCQLPTIHVVKMSQFKIINDNCLSC